MTKKILLKLLTLFIFSTFAACSVRDAMPQYLNSVGRIQSTAGDFNTESYDLIKENQFAEAAVQPLSTFSIDVDTASYSNFRRFVKKGEKPPKDAVRIEEFINYFSYDYPAPTGREPFSIATELSECPWNKKHKLLHIGIQGRELSADKRPASNLVFLLDTSGSMYSSNKLPLLKKAFSLLVNQLSDEDSVAIVAYAGSSGVALEPTSGSNKQAILDALNQLRAGGSTAGAGGIRLAYDLARKHKSAAENTRVILATDGDFNIGVSSDAELVRIIEQERKDGISLSVLGFGMGNYKDSKLEKLADHGNGNFAYIDSALEAKKVLVDEIGSTLFTIAKDVKIQVEFNPSVVKAYRLIGYENRLLNAQDFNDDSKDAGDLGAGHSVTALYELIPAGSTEKLPSVDALRYQEKAKLQNQDNELMQLKLRYKEPNTAESRLITKIVINEDNASSDNFKFAAAVAELGLLLRDSKFKADADYRRLISAARDSMGRDQHGYRAEFISLAEACSIF